MFREKLRYITSYLERLGVPLPLSKHGARWATAERRLGILQQYLSPDKIVQSAKSMNVTTTNRLINKNELLDLHRVQSAFCECT